MRLAIMLVAVGVCPGLLYSQEERALRAQPVAPVDTESRTCRIVSPECEGASYDAFRRFFEQIQSLAANEAGERQIDPPSMQLDAGPSDEEVDAVILCRFESEMVERFSQSLTKGSYTVVSVEPRTDREGNLSYTVTLAPTRGAGSRIGLDVAPQTIDTVVDDLQGIVVLCATGEVCEPQSSSGG